MLDPRAEYEQRLGARLKTLAEKEHLHMRAGNLKLATIVAGLVLLWLCVSRGTFGPAWLVIPLVAFFGLIVWHEQILRARTRAQTAADFYRRGIARLEDRWAGTGQSGDRFRDTNHIFADDVDLFGRGCLFELLSTARLPMGENLLAQWLRFPSPHATVLDRQKLVAGLRDRLDLRESIAVTGEELRARLDPESLTSWSEGARAMPSAVWRAVAVLLTLGAVGTFIYWLSTLRSWPFLVAIGVELLVYQWLHRRAMRFIKVINCNAEGILLFSEILASIERESFDSPHLQGLAAELKKGHQPASGAIRRLARTVFWVDSCEGLLARILDVPALYTIQVAFTADAWRHDFGAKIRRWIEIVAEMEALLSLASYSYEHPSDPFPQFVEGNGDAVVDSAVFDGQELGHPLIAAAKCVRNSVSLDRKTRLLMVSGSNMSGKSTFLRTVGINAVLARAGAPVRAKSLRMSPLVLGTRIRSMDSLQEGRSNFYTEILRIRKVFELAEHPEPILYLFDELLEGTNSKDRRIGAEGLLRALISRNAIGIVSTHDLALTEITESLGAVIRNQHFQDSVVDGEMRFDYKLRDGVVAKSNALELMRLIGLKV